MKITLLRYDLYNIDHEDFGIIAACAHHIAGQYPDPENCRNKRNFFKLSLIESGRATMFCGNRKIELAPGTIYLAHPDDLTSYGILEEPFSVCNILFHRESVRNFPGRETKELHAFFRIFDPEFDPGDDSPHLRALPAGREIEASAARLLREHRNPGACSGALKETYLHEILLLTARAALRADPASKAERIASAARDAVERHFQENFSCAKLASDLHITPNHLCETVRKSMGRSLTALLVARRLAEAEKLLGKPELSISEIAFRSGFNDLSYFYRAFRKRYGMNPGKCRKLFGQS